MGRKRTKKRAIPNSKAARAQIKSANSKPEHVKITFRKNHFQCFVCQDQDLSLSEYQMNIHQSLKIAMCDSCKPNHIDNDEWHSSKEWQMRDENGKSVYCEICGEGGTLIGCDEKSCSNSFCMECMKNWIGQEKLDKFLEDESIEFVCFCCFNKNLEKDLEGESKDNEDENNDEKDNDETDSKDEKEGSIYETYKKYLKFTKLYQGDKVELDELESDEKLIENFNKKAKIKQFKCYSCTELFEMNKKNLPQLHKDFKVTFCDSCYDYVDLESEENKKNWTFTDGKSDYCVITGQGGDIIECEEKDCQDSFCTDVLEKWMGHRLLNKYLKNDSLQFICFKCNPELGKCRKFQKQSQMALNAFLDEDGDYICDEPKKPVKKIKKPESTRKRSRGRKRKVETESENEQSDIENSTRVTRKINEKSSYFIKSDTDSSDESDYADINKEKKEKEAPPTSEEIKKYYRYMINTRCNKRFKDNEIFEKLLKILK